MGLQDSSRVFARLAWKVRRYVMRCSSALQVKLAIVKMAEVKILFRFFFFSSSLYFFLFYALRTHGTRHRGPPLQTYFHSLPEPGRERLPPLPFSLAPHNLRHFLDGSALEFFCILFTRKRYISVWLELVPLPPDIASCLFGLVHGPGSGGLL